MYPFQNDNIMIATEMINRRVNGPNIESCQDTEVKQSAIQILAGFYSINNKFKDAETGFNPHDLVHQFFV